MALVLAIGGLGLAEAAIAQTVIRDSETGAVQVDHNVFDIQTGPLENQSHIPLPAELIGETQERHSQPVIPDALSPNSVEIAPDVDYIEHSFDQLLGPDADHISHTLHSETLQMTTQFNLRHRSGAHVYGEGIEITVFGPDGAVRSRESVFVSGDRVTIGSDGQPLPATAELNVTYGANETVELRVLNIRQDGADPSESGIYFSQNGEFVVEDLQNGGDLDFNDGHYLQFFGGQGLVQTLEEHSNISYETQVVEIPLDPEIRQEVLETVEVVETLTQTETISEEERDWGQIELPETVATRLGHARAARTEDEEWLVYDRYSGASQVRLGSDGLGLTGQLPPLFGNPDAPPTLLTGNVTFDPTAEDNEAGLTATLSVTQFLHPTHRVAQDVFGNAITTANGDGPTLLEPAGLFTNRRLVGYVPSQPGETVLGTQLTSVDGIFELPTDRAVSIAPPDPQQVGRGNSAYTDNVGGLLLEDVAGNLEFVPQWTASGYAQEPIDLEPGSVRRIIYAIVPQQPGQTLQLGQRYEVTDSVDGYRITEGDFTIISADRQPQNFLREMVEIYAVEDTLPGRNAVTPFFNGIQGIYVEEVGRASMPTVDLTLPGEADARVGNALFPMEWIPPEPGQRAYAQTTVAAGFYLSGSLTGGIGNQRDTVTRVTSTVEEYTDEIRTQRTINTFATPLIQIDSFLVATTETTVERGTASFDIDSQGELTNVNLFDTEIQDHNTSSVVLGHTSHLQHGEEFLMRSVTQETTQLMEPRLELVEQDISTESESYPNFAPVQGEVALGGVLNFGNTPWSPAANTVRAELFVRDIVIGRGNGSETGWRAELVFHPFGEQQRAAFQYDEAGNVVSVYQTEPMLDADGRQVVETLTAEDGTVVTVPVNQFVLDEAGDRIVQTTGTGRPNGPGFYLRVEDVFSDDERDMFAGGIQFDF
ncbi:hypothetical protein [Vacuolonema iberomarrocanum]|uniref:hypothetical protein n=1 Tax=Vacuolonema iberomarrocanum TaxID=3454632 RepID=UPI0019F5A33B|nr:hypothetical protein [filamentous cyanobacterium LEGE 07170]